MFTVAVVKGEEPKLMVKRSIELLGGLSSILPEKNEKILIKPNLGCYKNAMTGATTDFRVVSSLIELLQSNGYENILVGDGPMYGFEKFKILDRLGVPKLCAKYNVSLVDLNQDESVVIKLSTGHSFRIAKTALKCKIINVPKLKTHNLTQVSLGIKNMLGCVVGSDKPRVHIAGLSENLVALAELLNPPLTIIDGIVGMEGDGPVAGVPIVAKVLVAGTNVLATDMIASKIMGFDPYRIETNIHAINRGLGPKAFNEIRIVGIHNLDEVTLLFKKPKTVHKSANRLLYAGIYFKSLLKDTKIVKKLVSTNYGFRVLHLLHLTPIMPLSEKPYKPPTVNIERCNGCGICLNACPNQAIICSKGHAEIIQERCLLCGCCVEVCPNNSISW
jgi:uncharacterized protein (DUF362 family)/NAD-dependent dihydropyrimidine dehydrogenase PreA subunit